MARLRVTALFLLCLTVPCWAAPIELANDRVRFTVDPAHGTIVSGQEARTGRAVFAGVSGVYRLGKPKNAEPLGAFDVQTVSEDGDELVPGSLRQTAGRQPSFVARYRNPQMPDLVIEKRYSLAPGADYVAKRLQFFPMRDLGLGYEYSLRVTLDPGQRAGSYYHCPMGIHFGQRVPTYLPAADITKTFALSGASETTVGGGTGMHSLVVCCNPARVLSAVTYRYREHDRFVRPAWISNLGASIYYTPDGWEMGVGAGYLAPGRVLSHEAHLQILPGDHVTAHRRWQQLPEWQKLVHDPSVANDQSPQWLDRVKVMGMSCEGVTGPLVVRDNYVSKVNEGPKMLMVAGPGVTVWSGDGLVGTVYFHDGGLYQKVDDRVIHDAAWFDRYLAQFRKLDPQMKLGLYFLSPDISTRYSTQKRGWGGSWVGVWEGLTLPGDIAKIQQEWAGNMRAHKADFIYMDGAAEMGGVVDFDRKVFYSNADSLALDKAVRAAARSLGPEHVYWRNSEINVYTDCGFAELSGFGSWADMNQQTGWRNLADRVLKVKLYERPGKWVAPLYANTDPEFVNYALGYGFRPWGGAGWPLVNGMYEMRNLRLADADIQPAWWRQGGEVEAQALTLGASAFLMAINHEAGAAKRVKLSADRAKLGLPADQPLYVWECAPRDDMANQPGMDDHSIQAAWQTRWASGACVQRRLVRVQPRPAARVTETVELPSNRLRQVVVTPVPGLIYAAHGYRRNYPLNDFCDLHLRGRLDLTKQQVRLQVDNREGPAEVALVAPADWQFVSVRLNGKPVAFEVVPEAGATLAVVAVGQGKHELVGTCEGVGKVLAPTLEVQTSALSLAGYVPGVQGQGLYVGERSLAQMKGLGPWDLSAGSIEFAFRADFPAVSQTSHVLLNLAGPQGSFSVYKLLNHDGLCFNIHAGDKDYPLHTPKALWQPGTWHRVRVNWSRAERFEEVFFDGQPVGRVERDLPDLSQWAGDLRLGRRSDDVWLAPAAFDDVVLRAGETEVLRLALDGDFKDAVCGRAGEVQTFVNAGETLPFSFALTGGGAPFWQVTREGLPVFTQNLTKQATGLLGRWVIREAKLTIPTQAERGSYEVRAGTIPGGFAPGVLARFAVQPQVKYPSHLARSDKELAATVGGQPATRVWTFANVGNTDPTCRAAFDPGSATFRLAAGTGYDQGNACAAGVEVSGLRELGVEFTETDDVRQPRPALYLRPQRGPNTFTGLVLDYHTPAGWTRRAAVALGGMTRRTSAFPDWAWGAERQRDALLLVDQTEGRRLGEPRRLRLDLTTLAPAGWDGRLVVNSVLHECLLTTETTLRVLPPEEAAALPLVTPRPLDLNPVIAAQKLRSPPTLDGVLDPAWQSLPELTPFYDLGNIGRVKQQTRARVGYDAAGLWVAVDCDDPAVVATQRGRDANVWADDEVEVFVQPGGSGHYYQFATNLLGTLFDTRDKVVAYNAEWQAAAQARPGGWVVEFRLPWAALEQAGPGAGWKLAVCRTERGGAETELSCWPVFAKRDFHLPESFAPVRFE